MSLPINHARRDSRHETDEGREVGKLNKGHEIVWSVAGFDPSSGAGVTADLMTFAAHGMFGCSAITALTAQNTRRVTRVEEVSFELFTETLDQLGEDMFPAGIKIGMLGSGRMASSLARWLTETQRRYGRPRPLVVLDPVLRSSSGRELFPLVGLAALREELLPQVDWVTPNWGELSLLTERVVEGQTAAGAATRELVERYPGLHVVATGGDQETPVDLLAGPDGLEEAFRGERVATTSTHGTGCAFSSALLAALVRGADARTAVWQAKRFVEGALRHAPGFGAGRGPMELLWPLRGGDVGSLEE